MFPSCRAPQWVAVGVYARIHWSNPSGKKIPEPNANRQSACRESGITCHWIWSLNAPCRWHFPPPDLQFLSSEESTLFSWLELLLLFTYAGRNKTLGVKLRFGSAAVTVSWDEFACPRSAGISFPTHHVLELPLPSSPPAPQHRTCSHPASSWQASPQSLHALEISHHIGGFSPVLLLNLLSLVSVQHQVWF